MKSLLQLYQEHHGNTSDKWGIYLSEYDRLFSSYRESPLSLLEIGVQNGGSLEIWGEYFGQAKAIVGCDINPDCGKLKYVDPKISLIVGDANTDESERQILAHAGKFDLIIDDGSHTSGDIVRTFARYFQHLSDGGLFVVEDLHCSYWQEFDGGLYDPYSSISFFKQLVDVVNYEHWGVEKKPDDVLEVFLKHFGCAIERELLSRIHSIEFINSLCVIRRAPAQENLLGHRYIVGEEENVVKIKGVAPLSSKQATLPQINNPWTARAFHPMEEVERQRTQIVEQEGRLRSYAQDLAMLREANSGQEQEIRHLTETVSAQELQANEHRRAIESLSVEIHTLRHSRSWRITAPLRWPMDQARRAKRVLSAVKSGINRVGGVKYAAAKAWGVYRNEGLATLKSKLKANAHQKLNPTPGSFPYDRNDYVEWIRRFDTIDENQRAVIRGVIEKMDSHPLISILVPTFNSDLTYLSAAIQSVKSQLYPYWELCIADDASSDERIAALLKKESQADSRIKIMLRSENGHISAASNSALSLAMGQWVALLDHDDLLTEDALFVVAHVISTNPEAKLIYSDEDKISQNGVRFDPHFKSDWNPALFLSQNMICHLGVYRTDLVRQIGGFRSEFDGAQDYDLALRYIERIVDEQIIHIPKVLYHWRVHEGSTAMSSHAKKYALTAGKMALEDYLRRNEIKGTIDLLDSGMYRVHYALPDSGPLVTIIIPTRNGLSLIKQCIESILKKTVYKNYEVLIIDNNSDDPRTLQYFSEISANSKVRVVRDERDFNYSALNNSAVNLATGEYVCLLNNDIEVISPRWLDEMMGHAIQNKTGVVGARLWYPDDTLQHGGVITGIKGVANHAHKHLPKGMRGYFSRAALIQNLSVVTAACLLVKKAIYLEVGGLNEADLKIAFNDVDFCLRVRDAGYRNVWTPYAELYHHESATRGDDSAPEAQARFRHEATYMLEHWKETLPNDPAYNRNLSLETEDFCLAWPPREHILCELYLEKTSL
ncbi:glycosyltransferase [Candidimonas humi]|uniref:Glycosyltransferase n=1 Tax=Candidimonas humi TaxID=683355 RepID=A0ABV8NVQ1_9BURK|nr:glycosyltransferase [Candidimonas humi]MBV6304446.1 glycosyltransferase [Candidimonas humi]